MRDGNGHMWATKFDVELLARYLGGELGFPVGDQTGLPGVYDFELASIRRRAELKRSRGQIEMVVVDHAEKASAN